MAKEKPAVPDAQHPAAGHYLGTVIDAKWWKRYRRKGFFARGNGVYWFEAGAFFFLRHLARQPLVIPCALIDEVKIGNSHAGRWVPGRGGLIKLFWESDGRKLVSGFIVSRDRRQTEALAEIIAQRLACSSGLENTTAPVS